MIQPREELIQALSDAAVDHPADREVFEAMADELMERGWHKTIEEPEMVVVNEAGEAVGFVSSFCKLCNVSGGHAADCVRLVGTENDRVVVDEQSILHRIETKSANNDAMTLVDVRRWLALCDAHGVPDTASLSVQTPALAHRTGVMRLLTLWPAQRPETSG